MKSRFVLKDNVCNCHPETCCCNPYVIMDLIESLKIGTYYCKIDAERVLNHLNNIKNRFLKRLYKNMLNRDDIAHEYALKLLQKDIPISDKGISYKAFNLADTMIAEAEKRTDKECPSILGDDWVSVTDHLPNKGGDFLVYRPHAHLKPNCDRNIKICEYSIKREDFIGSLHGISHWQELPSPPKGK